MPRAEKAGDWTIHIADSDEVRSEARRFRHRVIEAMADAECGPRPPVPSELDDRVDTRADLLFLRDRDGRIVASIQMTAVDRVDLGIARHLDKRHLALGSIEASFSRHLVFDPSVESEAIVEAMSTAIRIHAGRRGWRYDLCLCSDEHAGSRRRLGYLPIGIRVDREARSTLELYAFEVDPTNAASGAVEDAKPRKSEAPVESEESAT
ncbi:MAG: hypothetical protein GY895_03790 [Phycisphaera sp.]|nr:hypothetical protein [Phycisphaera sp.]